MVYVSVDPLRCEWLFQDAQGNQVRAQPAKQLCRERIVTLKVRDHRKRSGRTNHVSGLSGQTMCRVTRTVGTSIRCDGLAEAEAHRGPVMRRDAVGRVSVCK